MIVHPAVVEAAAEVLAGEGWSADRCGWKIRREYWREEAGRALRAAGPLVVAHVRADYELILNCAETHLCEHVNDDEHVEVNDD